MELNTEEQATLRGALCVLQQAAAKNGAMDSRWDLVFTGEAILKKGECWPYASPRQAYDAITKEAVIARDG